MSDVLFRGVFDSANTSVIGVTEFLLCIMCALLCGAMISAGHMYKNRYTGSFILTLAILPAVVCVVIMMVSGNIGTGVAVAGTFSLVRFRSAPGSAREISMLFLAMGAGLIAGMGYLMYALMFAAIMCAVSVFYTHIGLGCARNSDRYRTLNITIPENISYTEVFESVFEKYTDSAELVKVKTTNMGSLYKLTYNVILRENFSEKMFIDELRIRNGNLEISVSRQENVASEL